MPAVVKKKPLAKNCQKAPAVDVKAKGLWPPKGGTQYKVQTGDNWVSLAKAWNVTTRQLIGFNFNTDKAREVNWYLDTYVGCVERTADCCNWRFSSEATPGIIYKPWDGYPRPHGDPTVPVPPASDPDPIADEP
ncbi:MAG TPA: LysM domain-containing protein, partial [Pirellulaceae bacterium]|nr:LysM domain-containing protein [Pirellulaceae bacterium]